MSWARIGTFFSRLVILTLAARVVTDDLIEL